MKDVLIIIDDLRAGKIAAELHLNFAGTPGVPVKAKQTGMISSIRPVLQKMRSIKFKISLKVEEFILTQCGEQ